MAREIFRRSGTVFAIASWFGMIGLFLTVVFILGIQRLEDGPQAQTGVSVVAGFLLSYVGITLMVVTFGVLPSIKISGNALIVNNVFERVTIPLEKVDGLKEAPYQLGLLPQRSTVVVKVRGGSAYPVSAFRLGIYPLRAGSRLVQKVSASLEVARAGITSPAGLDGEVVLQKLTWRYFLFILGVVFVVFSIVLIVVVLSTGETYPTITE